MCPSLEFLNTGSVRSLPRTICKLLSVHEREPATILNVHRRGSVLRSLASGAVCFVCCVCILIAGCAPPHGGTTESTITIVNGAVSTPMDDPSALHTLNSVEGCVANGLVQTGDPLFFGWQYVGTSPGPGKCHFSDAPYNGTASVFFQSGACFAAGQPGNKSVPSLQFTNGTSPAQNVCTAPSFSLPQADGHFAYAGQFPASVTIDGSGLSSTYGLPQLLVYDVNGTLQGTATATSVAGDGSNATFPFPNATGGGALPSGFYMFAVKNVFDSSGSAKVVTATYFNIGSPTSAAGAFGVDAAELAYREEDCTFDGLNYCCDPLIQYDTPTAVVTLYSTGQVIGTHGTISVGSQPTSVKAYGNYDVYQDTGYGGFWETDEPSNAIVTNMGSNTVSILDLVNNTLVTNVAIGSQPVAVAVNPNWINAYVANYGDGTLSEVNLSNYTVSRTVSIGTAPQSVAMDPAGSAVWVGGGGYLRKVDLSSFSVVYTASVSGTVTSLAASNQQNRLVYSLVTTPCCEGGSTYAAGQLQLSNLTETGNYGNSSANAYAISGTGQSLPNASVSPQGCAVSAQFGNGMGACATATGFVVYDIVANQEVMRGTTPTPVRGIAGDPDNKFMYLTLPDSNQYITVPLIP